MAFKRQWVEDWVGEHAPGERLVSHLVTATWKGFYVTGTFKAGAMAGQRAEQLTLKGEAAFNERIQALGLDPNLQVAPMVDASFFALTEQRLLFGSRSGMRNRPKDLLHAAPVGSVTVYWYDHDEGAGNRFRHLLVQFGDGRWRAERSGLSALGKDLTDTSNAYHFAQALGSRGHSLDG